MAMHIPGYYYDADKNRYFKITSEKPGPPRTPKPAPRRPSGTARDTCKPPRSIYNFVNTRQLDFSFQDESLRSLHNRVLCNIHKTACMRCPAKEEDYGAWVISDMSTTSDWMAYICGTADRRLLEVVSLSNVGLHNTTELSYDLTATTCIPGAGLDAVCVDSKDLLLFVQDHRLCYVQRSSDPHASPSHECRWSSVRSVGVGWPVCAIAWNHCCHTFPSHSAAVGLENGGAEVVTHLNRTSTHYRSSVHSSVLSLAFASQGSPLLYAGHRSGHIQVWDLRSKQTCPAMTCCEEGDAMRSSVVALRPLTDSTYLLSSAFNSKLGMWDMRMRRKVRLFTEHVNDFRRCPFLLDRFESTVIAAGSDAAVRIWSMASGQLQCVVLPENFRVGSGHPCVPVLGMCEDSPHKRDGTMVAGPAILVALNSDVSVFQF